MADVKSEMSTCIDRLAQLMSEYLNSLEYEEDKEWAADRLRSILERELGLSV